MELIRRAFPTRAMMLFLGIGLGIWANFALYRHQSRVRRAV